MVLEHYNTSIILERHEAFHTVLMQTNQFRQQISTLISRPDVIFPSIATTSKTHAHHQAPLRNVFFQKSPTAKMSKGRTTKSGDIFALLIEKTNTSKNQYKHTMHAVKAFLIAFKYTRTNNDIGRYPKVALKIRKMRKFRML